MQEKAVQRRVVKPFRALKTALDGAQHGDEARACANAELFPVWQQSGVNLRPRRSGLMRELHHHAQRGGVAFMRGYGALPALFERGAALQMVGNGRQHAKSLAAVCAKPVFRLFRLLPIRGALFCIKIPALREIAQQKVFAERGGALPVLAFKQRFDIGNQAHEPIRFVVRAQRGQIRQKLGVQMRPCLLGPLNKALHQADGVCRQRALLELF